MGIRGPPATTTRTRTRSRSGVVARQLLLPRSNAVQNHRVPAEEGAEEGAEGSLEIADVSWRNPRALMESKPYGLQLAGEDINVPRPRTFLFPYPFPLSSRSGSRQGR